MNLLWVSGWFRSAPLLATSLLLAACGGPWVLVKPVSTNGQEEVFDKGKVTVVSVESQSAVAAKTQETVIQGPTFSIFLGVSNLSGKAFNVDHTNIAVAATSNGISVTPMSADEAKTYIMKKEGAGTTGKLNASLGMLQAMAGALSGNAAAVSQGQTALAQTAAKQEAAGKLTMAAESSYFAKTTVIPGATADGLIMLRLSESDGDPMDDPEKLLDQFIDLKIRAGADEHVVRLNFPAYKR